MQRLTICCGGLGGASPSCSELKNCIMKAPNPRVQTAYPPPSLLKESLTKQFNMELSGFHQGH